jgi:hypothetical protein
MTTGEPMLFAAQITYALRAADVEVVVCQPRLGQIAFGVELLIPDAEANVADYPLKVALRKVGVIENDGRPRSKTPMGDIQEGLPVIFVGEKFPKFMRKPETN